MNILLIEDELEARNVAHAVLTSRFRAKNPNIVLLKLIQEGIELLEKQTQAFDLIIFGYSGTGQALVKCLIDYGGPTSYVMCVPDAASYAAFLKPELTLELAVRMDLGQSLPRALDRIDGKRPLGDLGTPDTDFVQINTNTLVNMSPIKCDIFIRLSENRYIRLIRKGDELQADDFKKFRDMRRAEMLYVRKADADTLIDGQVAKVQEAVANPNLTEAEGDRVSAASLDAVKDIVGRMGFTPKAQALAKASVEITLKLLGARPKLSAVLSRLQKEEGKYISSHSITLGKIACAMAYKVGWNSAATYLKLTLAAFLHDLPLEDNDLASYTSLEQAKKSGKFSDAQLADFKLHPYRASEYAKQFHEIPADVDQILFQHHERPDGTGFPRSLTQKQLSPLGAIFIIAHDLFHFMLENPTAPVETFFVEREALYNVGTLRKIYKSLKDENTTPTQ